MLTIAENERELLVQKIKQFINWRSPDSTLVLEINEEGNIIQSWALIDSILEEFKFEQKYVHIIHDHVNILQQLDQLSIRYFRASKETSCSTKIITCYNALDSNNTIKTIEQTLLCVEDHANPTRRLVMLIQCDVSEINPTRKITNDIKEKNGILNKSALELKKSVSEILLKDTPILTNREQLILQEIANGKTSQEISSELKIAKSTVDKHRQNMIKKFNVKNITALIQLSAKK